MIVVVLSNTRWKRSTERLVEFLLANRYTGIFRYPHAPVIKPQKFDPSSMTTNPHNPNLSKTYSNNDRDKTADNISKAPTVTTRCVKSDIVFNEYLLPS